MIYIKHVLTVAQFNKFNITIINCGAYVNIDSGHYKTFSDAVRRSCPQGTTNRDIIIHIMSWFKHSIDRYRNEYIRQV